MSVKGKKAGLAISWQKSFSILAPWRKGKGHRDALQDSEVVLTKMKLFSHFHERLRAPEDTAKCSESLCNVVAPTGAPEAIARHDSKSGPPWAKSGSDLSAIFCDSKLQRLYKFESEDSGVELPSGANSPSTPTGSEQSFIVHSRESSCDSRNLTSGPAALTEKLATYAQSSEIQQAEDPVEGLSLAHVEDLGSPAVRGDPDQSRAPDLSPEGSDEPLVKPEDSGSILGLERVRKYGTLSSTGPCGDFRGDEFEPKPLWRSSTSESLEEYMEECCKLSEAQQEGCSSLGSGLGYLEHICQLLKKIGQLQETNLRLQRQICGLQKEGRVMKTKEDFFRLYCSCGAASLAFQDVPKRHTRGECLSPSGTLSDLSTIPEVSRYPLLSPQTGVSGDGLRRRGLNRRSYTEGEVRFLDGGAERVSAPQRRMSDSYSWGRVKDLVRRTRMRNPGRLGLTSTSLKMSCPQLYLPDPGSVEPTCRKRSSMIVLGHQSRLDFPWQQ